MARGISYPYWLIRSHMGIWYFTQAISIKNTSAEHFLQYLGCEIIKTFDSKGDEVGQ